MSVLPAVACLGCLLTGIIVKATTGTYVVLLRGTIYQVVNRTKYW